MERAARATPATVEDRSSGWWLRIPTAARGGRARCPRMMRRTAVVSPSVRLPREFVTVFAGREPVAIGRAVADDGWTGVFGMVTAPQAKRQGAARMVLAVIAGWAARRALRGSTFR